ncbi:MAG: GntR family transcriptional regulator [Eubacteriales bacterium]|nr:GntR family transcriptional regulator [Eubacteriales bacterium]
MAEINKQTISEQIYQVLREDILTQNIKCGTKLTLQSLKNRFQTSHTPIREALTRLVEDNLVTYYSNIGISVVLLDENDAREIFELNGDFDCLALRYAYTGNQKETLIKELEKIISKSQHYIDKNQLNSWRHLSDQFHLVFYKYANNSRLDDAARKLRAQTTLLYNLYQLEDKNAEIIQMFHCQIYEAIKQDNLSEALKLFKKHLNQDMHLAIKAINRQQMV